MRAALRTPSSQALIWRLHKPTVPFRTQMPRLPDRTDAIRAITDLTTGRRTRTDVARWAQIALYHEDTADIRDSPYVDHTLADALTLLATADWEVDGHPQLSEADFLQVLDRLQRDPLHRRDDDEPIRFASRAEVEAMLVEAVSGDISRRDTVAWANQALRGQAEALATGAWDRDEPSHRALCDIVDGRDPERVLDELRAVTAAEVDDPVLDERPPDRAGIIETLDELLAGKRSRTAAAVWARRGLDVWARIGHDPSVPINFDQPAFDTLQLLLEAAVTWYGRPHLHDLPTFVEALHGLRNAPPARGPGKMMASRLPKGGLGERLASLEEARTNTMGAAVLEGDWGGQIFATCPSRLVECSHDALMRLTLDLDSVMWGEPDGASVRYEVRAVGSSVPGGMGGAEIVEGVWVHDEVRRRGLARAVRDIILNRRGPLTMDELADAMEDPLDPPHPSRWSDGED